MLERLKQYQDHWATLSEPEREIEELLATRELLQGDMVDEDGNICSLWDYAVNTQLEELSAETGFARDTDEDPEDVRCPAHRGCVLGCVCSEVWHFADHWEQARLDAPPELPEDAIEAERGRKPRSLLHGARLSSTLHSCAQCPWRPEPVSTKTGLCIRSLCVSSGCAYNVGF